MRQFRRDRRSIHPAWFAIALFLALPPHRCARAGGTFDLYGGAAIHAPADVRVSERTAAGTRTADACVAMPSEFEFGARLQGWPRERAWYGLAMDVGYFGADGDSVHLDVIPLSFALLLRAPLFSTPGIPEGRLQPYAMAGLSFYMVDVDVTIDGLGGSSFQMGWPLTWNSGLWTGPYLAAGVAWQPAARWSLFGEYRYSSLKVGFDTVDSPIIPTMNGRVDVSLQTNHALAGVSYRFGEPDKPAKP